MDGCRRVTDDAIEMLAHFCPQINILIFHGCPNITGCLLCNLNCVSENMPTFDKV